MSDEQKNAPGMWSFKGRIGRAELWIASVVLNVTSALIYLVAISSGSQTLALIGGLLLALPFTWLSVALQVKRWHDLDKSGWMVLVNFIPIFGWLYSLLNLGFYSGTSGTNQYGDIPP